MPREKYTLQSLRSLNLGAIGAGLQKEGLALVFLLIYFIFEYIRPQILYRSIDILPWAQLFMILAIAASIVDKRITWQSNLLSKWFVIFGFVILLSGILALYPSAAWDYRNTMLGWLIIYFLVICIVNTEQRLIIFTIFFLLFSLKMAQHGAIDWARRGFSFTSWGLVGAPGWFKNSGEYAIQMLIFSSLTIAFGYGLKEHLSKAKLYIVYTFGGMGLMAIMGASSRGAQLALAAISIWLIMKHRSGVKGLMLIGILALGLYYFLPDEQMERFREMGTDDTSVQRLVYWDIGVDIAKTYPVLGIGHNNWIPYVTQLYPDGVGPLKIVELPHSIYVQAAAELGFTGLGVFIILILIAFLTNRKTRKYAQIKDNKFLYFLSFGLDAGLIGYLVAGAFVTVLYYPFFWIQIAIIAALNNVARKNAAS